jgi:hypothetical protein
VAVEEEEVVCVVDCVVDVVDDDIEDDETARPRAP